MEPLSLDGRVVVVTGAGRGIGQAIAIRAADAGARVAVVSRSMDQLDATVAAISRRGGAAAAFVASVTDAAAIDKTFEQIARSFGAIDVLVNNAGTIGPFGPFGENDNDEWWQGVEVNLRGPAICTRAVLPMMIARRSGRIVNVSTGGAETAMTYFSSYIVAKTALVRLTECLAAEIRPYGLSAFAIGPGTVRTAMSEQSLTSVEGRRWLPWFRRIFDDGLDVPADVPAALVAKLASGRYDALTGRFVTVADDLERLLQETATIDRERLYALRVNRLPAAAAVRPASRAIADAATGPAGLTLRLERSLPLSLNDAFAAWIDPAAIARWFVQAADWRWVTSPEVDARPGGAYRFHVTGAGGVLDFTGAYREISKFRRLEFTWRWQSLPILDGAGDTTVLLEFDQSEGTHVTLVQRHLPDENALETHRRLWAGCFDAIATLSAV